MYSDVMVNTILNIACLSFLFPLFVCVSVRKHRGRRADYFFTWLIALEMALCLSDIPNWLFPGTDNAIQAFFLKAGSLVYYTVALPTSLVYMEYLVTYLGCSERMRRTVRKVVITLIGIWTATILLNLKFGFFYYVDPATNDYYRGPVWIVSMIIPSLPLIFDLIILFQNRKQIVASVMIGTVLYIALPIAGAVLQIIYNGAPYINWFVAIAIFILYFTVNTEMRYQLEKQKKELLESKTTIMLSQIQPHFLYNSLTTIAALCEKSPAEAKRATLDFSRYLRCNIDSVDKRIPVPFKQELEHVQTYLNLEKLRFEKRLNVIMDIQTTDFLIPALTIQPLVENSVKHGICNKENGNGTLIVSTIEADDCFKIIIRDDGQGFDTTKKPDDGREHIGIENVRSRLYSMIGAKMTIESEIGRGTIVTVMVPKETNVSKKKKKKNEFI